jgi:xanthine dehydrogenase small subunit
MNTSMTTRIRCILNDCDINTVQHPATTVLDFVRRTERLTGTKEGCREGDCGACTVLVGELQADGQVVYKPVNSCLLPLGALHGKHLVTVEGLNSTHTDKQHRPPEQKGQAPQPSSNLSLVQQAMADAGGTQCGFCTPGFIVSMTGYALSASEPTSDGMMAAIDGNVCRCTGYMSIRRAAERIVTVLQAAATGTNGALSTNGLQYTSQDMSNHSENHGNNYSIVYGIVPPYFLTIARRLQELQDLIHAEAKHQTNTSTKHNGNAKQQSDTREAAHDDTIGDASQFLIGGGTDLFVQKPDKLLKSRVRLLTSSTNVTNLTNAAPTERDILAPLIREQDGWCILDATTPIAELQSSPIIRRHLPQMPSFLTLFASTPIRNRATLGGNINNASPIGDMTAILLALNTELTLSKAGKQRKVLLREFYKGYKTLDREPGEIVESLRFKLPVNDENDEAMTTLFNYEKVSRRTYLDIASVNTALQLRLRDGIIAEAHASAGGVAPIPLYLARTSASLVGKPILPETAHEAASIACSEISPISDARGSIEYKRLLLRNLMYAHFLTFFPDLLPSSHLAESMP